MWKRIGGDADWPTEAQWDELAALDRLDEVVPARTVTPRDRRLTETFDLPMPGVSMVELKPIAGGRGDR